MKAPKCRLCQKIHYGQCAEFELSASSEPARDIPLARPKKSEKKSVLSMPVMGSGKLNDRIATLEVVVAELVERLDGMDRRREYQKKYMKKWREEK